MQPAKLQSLLQSALAHHRAGRWADAELLYRQVRAAAPKNFDVLHLSGLLAYQQGKIAAAVDWLGRANKIDPRQHACAMHYALALIAARRVNEAEKHLRHAVATKPDFHEGWDNLAYCLKVQNRLTEALGVHQKCVEAKPDFPNGWYNLGLTLSLLGRSADALTCHDRALKADARYTLGHFGRAQALHQMSRLTEAVAEYTTFLAAEPKHHDARSYRLFALQFLEGIPRERLFAEHVDYGRAVGPAPRQTFPNAPAPDRPLRLAIFSTDLREHACAYFLEPLLRHLPGDFEVFLYHDHIIEDEVSARFKARAARWRNFVIEPVPEIERTIRADAPDIIVDLCGHTGMTGRLPLFARRLAPVQVTYLGYPDTTGVPAMDYRFTDAHADPEGEADAFATEKLVRFAPTAWSYQPGADAPAVAPSAVPASRDHVTFGCFNSLAKITDRMLAVWGAILGALPTARLQLKGRGLGEPALRAKYLARFERARLPADRVDLIERTVSAADHLALYQGVDVALDSFPYHGTTTTCEALWMGVPVVTLRGDRHASRVGASLVRAVGHPEWIAAEEADYVRIALELAAAGPRSAQARETLRDEMRRSPLLDHPAQAARFAAALRACWQTWCAAQSKPAVPLARSPEAPLVEILS